MKYKKNNILFQQYVPSDKKVPSNEKNVLLVLCDLKSVPEMFVKGKPIIQFEFISNTSIHSLSNPITENSWFVFEQGKKSSQLLVQQHHWVSGRPQVLARVRGI